MGGAKGKTAVRALADDFGGTSMIFSSLARSRGKQDYATWFSAEPSAMLGILLIGPFADYLAVEPKRIRDSVAEAALDGFDVQVGDYLLPYQALACPQDTDAAQESAQELPGESIDDGSSRAYLLA